MQTSDWNGICYISVPQKQAKIAKEAPPSTQSMSALGLHVNETVFY